jgi:intracellular sulfur oxidation DsrE/DsrF family protein
MPDRRRSLITALVAGIALAVSSGVWAVPKKKPAAATKERVVIQVTSSDPKHWNHVLTTAKQLKSEYGDDKVDVAIIAIGPGVNMFKEGSDVANRVENAVARKIFVIACGASMKSLNLEPDDLARHIFVVPSGAVEIVKRQRAGWTYLRL